MFSPVIERCLISVSDKRGLAEFARGLGEAGVEIFSTGGTRRLLEQEGIAVRDVSDYTGFPEMMDGRLKTLHPKVHGGILCRHDRPDDMAALADHQILAFPLVVVNLYPFESTVARPDVTLSEAIEQIDIGGPTLIRAAAKNHAFTTVATDPAQYEQILQEVRQEGRTTAALRRQLALAAFRRTAQYDRAISDYLATATAADAETPFPDQLQLSLVRRASLRYGENPHQQAALYADPTSSGNNLVTARQLNGKELSYNNLLDLDSALAIVSLLPAAGAVVIKHNNPCGAAVAERQVEAARLAFEGDPVSAFGSVLGFNQPLEGETAELLVEPGKFVEAIVAPSYHDQALQILTTRPKWKANVRLLEVGPLAAGSSERQIRQIAGGLLVQQADDQPDEPDEWKIVTQRQPSDAQLADLRFAWTMVRSVKSNAIVLCKDRGLCGVGAGQMSRVDAVEIAIRKAGQRAVGSVLASDAFFPFPDSIQAAATAGISALIQPGGSRRDEEVIAACDQRQLPMIFTGRRHFKH
ncbi:MAG: bifunctional phosphoribosylaminoimidazolecarboxamide formyltransferase/IMP cyclohydrolase [Planctomycetales bacterium]|nr:bifunctional phosphoribosylaminoimidazolecarboxamide formyltransferase/IMP cyclohydrolase [Planctomycetales bacterium]NIM08826.1 bifunctional phosphoribosylaminoimidazolecarboxamide formyltransferase/IMP cyclohydrolase [Planctomycetales bacterium]NIN08287.1 bifunctional phosphoribosylaminoimidazolecarboxamide formyltransferase/IMP cyclohydrolase [Planctomycetales bacterium]NIN77416.1 bifunctional phosphoribosylaminoimidazolecarboxamide formyltransferase/IMP cyclohydrolase [Planctomycetales ba